MSLFFHLTSRSLAELFLSETPALYSLIWYVPPPLPSMPHIKNETL